MKVISVLRLICLACLAGGCSACGDELVIPAATASQPPGQQSPPDYSTSITTIIEDILASPQEYVGTPVEVTGYYQGWDLLGEVGEAPPVTRSDWVIADQGGALYVTGMLPEGLNPASLDDVGAVIRLTATVAMQQEQVYLQAQAVQVLP
jgi:hypothetical protein